MSFLQSERGLGCQSDENESAGVVPAPHPRVKGLWRSPRASSLSGASRDCAVYCRSMLAAFPHIQPILHALVAAGARPQIVGGAVRDLLRGEAVKDVDI